jgi:type I restriction enzyme S subunit
MKQEIKERVERIRKGEVPEGYRETNVGIISDDWDVVEADMKSFLDELGL